jgi:hypothetical protein
LRGVRQAPVGGLERFFYNSFENQSFLLRELLSHRVYRAFLRAKRVDFMREEAAQPL